MSGIGDTERRRPLLDIALVLLATAVSMGVVGFEFGVGNNVFHIPYVLRLDELPVFQGDAFYQSLDSFTSIVWPILRAFSNERNVESVFLISHILSRAAAFAALLWLFRTTGATRLSTLLAALLAAAVSPWLTDVSAVGGHGLFLPYFTHSEGSWGPLVAALVAAHLGRLKLSALLVGIVFSINAFIGIWLAAIILFPLCFGARDRWDWKLLATASAVFVIISTPVAIWITVAIRAAAEVEPFSFIEYVRAYFPQHFLVESVQGFEARRFLAISYCGLMAALLTPDRRFWLAVLAGCWAILAVGVVAPYLIDNRFVFNLHLLRSAGLLQFLAIVLSISASARIALDGTGSLPERSAALAVGFSLMVLDREPLTLVVAGGTLTLLVALRSSGGFLRAGLARLEGKGRAELFRPVGAVIWVIAAGIVLASALASREALARTRAERGPDPFRELVAWVREGDASGPFLLPVREPYRVAMATFQLDGRKPVWVDWKQGAAVMWDPSFYWIWMPRFKEVEALSSPVDFLEYAAGQGIPLTVLPAGIGDCPPGTIVNFRNAGFSVCSQGN